MRLTSMSGLSSILFVSVLMLAPLHVHGQEKAVLDPDKADADFAYQGEYLGEVEIEGAPTRVGVQVIARGNGKLVAVAYLGGLPGDGWNGQETRKGEGTVKTGLNFPGDADVRIHEGVMTVKDLGGTKIGELKKVLRKSPTLEKRHRRAPSCFSMEPRQINS